MLGDVLPDLTLNNRADGVWGDAVLSGKRRTAMCGGAKDVFGSDCNNLALGKPRLRVVRSSGPASLYGGIAHVVALGANEQVAWPHAAAVIATMANEHAGRYWTVCNEPSQTMRPAPGETNDVCFSVSLPVYKAGPNPALVAGSSVYKRPKPVGRCRSVVGEATGHATALAAIAVQFRKDGLAVRACS